MTDPGWQARRATIDDLPELRGLWSQAGLPVEALERRVTEFQVVEGPDQQLAGAAGLQIARQQGRIFGEAWISPAARDEGRPKLLERLIVLARNHGLSRLWSDSPEWMDAGFQPPGDLAKRLPAEFAGEGATWWVYPLREETERLHDIEQEFEIFKQAQQAESERALQQAKVLRALAWLLAAILFLTALGAGLYVLRNLPPGWRP